MIDGGELMTSLVFCYGVRVLCGDILLKANSYLCCIWVHWFCTFVDLIRYMRNMVLSATRLITYWCIVFLLICKSMLVATHINWSNPIPVELGSLSSPQWVCQQMGSHACVQWHPCSWTLVHVKLVSWWWFIGVPHSSRSDSGCVPSTPLPLASSYLASEMGIPYILLSISTCGRQQCVYLSGCMFS